MQNLEQTQKIYEGKEKDILLRNSMNMQTFEIIQNLKKKKQF